MQLKVSRLYALIGSCLILLFLAIMMPALFEACNGGSENTTANSKGMPSVPGDAKNPATEELLPQISLRKIADGFSNPTFIGNAGDGSNRLFIVEQPGTIRVIRNGTVVRRPFLDITSRVSSGGERGLLVVVFPPGFGGGKRHFYVNYTGTRGGGDTFISRCRLTADPDTADPDSEQILLTVKQPFGNHNGGQMAFGADGYLYIGMGDGGGAGDPAENAQNPGSLLGKMLRIDVESAPTGTYRIPSGNPFLGRAGYRPEIWALGLRNPWRFSFDRQTGDLHIADVGQASFEEIDLQTASSRGGENYGWDIMEGFSCYRSSFCDKTGLTLPVFTYAHENGDCSVTGGHVYRGAEFPALQGVFIYGDYCSGRIWGLRQAGGTAQNQLLLDSDLRISTFGTDEAGNLYVADHSGGGIYKIIVQASP